MKTKFTNFINKNKFITFSFTFFLLFGITINVFATPPSSPYGAGDTLDPSCAPGDSNCYVSGSSSDIIFNSVYVGRGGGSLETNVRVGDSTSGWGGALGSNTTGVANTAFGYDALSQNTTGDVNTAVGKGALYSNTTGSNNTGLGFFALLFMESGSNNTGVGGGAVAHNLDGTGNVGIGVNALQTGVTGDYNIGIGFEAGKQSYTGDKNIAIGYNIDFPSDSGSQQLTIGNLIFGTTLDGTSKTVSSGKIGIGDASPDYRFDVDGDASSSYVGGFFNDGNSDNRYGILIQAGADSPSAGRWIQFNDGDGGDVGTISLNTGTLTLTTTSDQRLKENIENTSIGLSNLRDIQVRDFSFISDNTHKTIHGFIAQELYEAYPDAVVVPEDPSKYWQVSFTHLIPLAIKSIQELDITLQGIESLDKNSTFVSNLKNWFASATNGIERMFSREIETQNLCVSDESGNKTCLTKADLDALISGSGQSFTTIIYSNDGGEENQEQNTDEEEITDEEDTTTDEEVTEETTTEETNTDQTQAEETPEEN